ncbi:MAG: XRE family transcriptional regulator [Bacteroidia bacterium]|nr:XRE family transcriptional regulator [Bacteroidia bacterium]
MDLKQLGTTIMTVRRKLAKTQEAVAADLDISLTAYSKIERGETNIQFNRLSQIADYFNMEPWQLLCPTYEFDFNEFKSEFDALKLEIKTLRDDMAKYPATNTHIYKSESHLVNNRKQSVRK